MAATKLRLYQDAVRLLADARLNVITDDVTTRYALDDAWDSSVAFVLGALPWRFAMKTQPLALAGTPMTGYTTSYGVPSDAVRDHAIFIAKAGREFPFDLRVQQGFASTNATSIPTMRFVSSVYADPAFATWPELFASCLAAYLAFSVGYRVTGEVRARTDMSQLFSSMLDQAKVVEGIPEDPWFSYQLSGEFLRAAHAVIPRGYWWFGLKTARIDVQQGTGSAPGFPYRFDLPADWLRTHALFIDWGGIEAPIDIRQTTQHWSTDQPQFVARYLSTDALLAYGANDTVAWPEAVSAAVLAYCELRESDEEEAQEGQKPSGKQQAAALFQAALSNALSLYSRPEDQWLRHQLNGAWIQGALFVAEKARWKFGIKTVDLTADSNPSAFSDGTPSPGYGFHFTKPADWIRTVWLYRALSSGLYAIRQDIDYRDEGASFHANYSAITARYLTRGVLDSPRWTMNFRDCVLAWLQHFEVRDDPKLAGVAAERLKMFVTQLSEAEGLDDAQEQPRVNTVGRFVRGRYRGRGGGAQGPGMGSSDTILT